MVRKYAWVSIGLMSMCGVAALGQGATAAERCGKLAGVTLPQAKVTAAALAGGGRAIDGVKLPPGLEARIPAFCRVQVRDTPSEDSEIRTEVWLPVEHWDGRFRGTGNGGFAGVVYFGEMAAAVAEGYATAGTDTGHVGGEGTFALGHPEKVKDFGWRAVHDMTVEAKALVAAFYGKPAAKSYFAGCSDGGREALMEAQRFPEDYDGILAGAPAFQWTSLVTGGATQMKAMLASPGGQLTAAKVPLIAAAVNRACDAKDGVKDGVVNDPRACGFEPATLVCKAGDGADCLTPGEAATLKRIYSPVRVAKGAEIEPGLLPGGEEGDNGWTNWITGVPKKESAGIFFAQGYFRNFVYGDPRWSIRDFNTDKAYKAAREKTGAALDARETNLKPFTGRGGKLILYHGWNDPAIPALGTVEYFAGLQRAMGSAAVDESVRLYMVPGMQHCGGGPGATEFGQSGTNARGDAGHDVFTALEQWVEAGKAPGTIVAEKTGAQRRVEFTRPLCVYPAVAKYVGGENTEAKSFVCAKP